MALNYMYNDHYLVVAEIDQFRDRILKAELDIIVYINFVIDCSIPYTFGISSFAGMNLTVNQMIYTHNL